MHPILKGILARCATLLPSAVATLLASRLILHHYDIAVFNAYTLVFTTMVLIPLNDLGAGAALTSAVAADGSDHPHTRQVALTAARVLLVSGLGLVVAALAFSLFGLWHDVLGGGAFATGTFGFAIAAYGLSFVPGLGQSALLGANKNDLTILVQAFLAPAMCVGAALTVAFHLQAKWVVVVPGIAVLVISLANAWVSARVTGLRLLPLLPKLPFRHRHPGATIRGIAGPALIVTLTAPVTLQGDRLVLSHFSTAHAVAKYSVAVQIWAPLIALIAAAARPLWPMYAQARATGRQPVSITKVVAAFVAVTALASAVLCVIAGPLATAIGGNEIHLGVALPLATGVAVSIQAAAVPLAMAMMYPAGLRLIAALSLICTPINLGLSILVSPHFGAPGPLYVSIGVATFLQVVPGLVHMHRHPILAIVGDGGGGEPLGDGMAMVPVAASTDEAVFVDAGLSVLSGEPDGYAEYAEYAEPEPELAPPERAAPPAAASVPPVGLEPYVADAVARALTNPIVDLQLNPTVLHEHDAPTFDAIGRIADRVAHRDAQLDAVARQVEELAVAIEDVRAASQEVVEQHASLLPPGSWADVQRGDEQARRSLDQLTHEVRRRQRRGRG